MPCARVFQESESEHPVGAANDVTESNEAAVVVSAQVESLPPQPLHEPFDAIYFVVIGRPSRGRIGPAEAGPVRRHDMMAVGQRRDLMAPAGGALRVAVQQHWLPGAGLHREHLAPVDIPHGGSHPMDLSRCGAEGPRAQLHRNLFENHCPLPPHLETGGAPWQPPRNYDGAGPTNSCRMTGAAQRLSSSRLRLAIGGLTNTYLVVASPMTKAPINPIR
jgi:hypothetical protein